MGKFKRIENVLRETSRRILLHSKCDRSVSWRLLTLRVKCSHHHYDRKPWNHKISKNVSNYIFSCCCSFLWPPSSVAKKCRENNLNFPFRELFKQYFFPMALSSQITSDSQGVLRLLRYLANVSQLPKFFAMKEEKCKKSKLSTYFLYSCTFHVLFVHGFLGTWKFKHF